MKESIDVAMYDDEIRLKRHMEKYCETAGYSVNALALAILQEAQADFSPYSAAAKRIHRRRFAKRMDNLVQPSINRANRQDEIDSIKEEVRSQGEMLRKIVDGLGL